MSLPQAIWARSGLPAHIDCVGDTVGGALADCCRRLPQLALYLRGPTLGKVGSVAVFASGKRVVDFDQILREPTELRVVIPSAGG